MRAHRTLIEIADTDEEKTGTWIETHLHRRSEQHHQTEAVADRN